MNFPSTLLAAAALSVASLSAAPVNAQDLDADTVIVSIDGTEITLGHMLALRSVLPPHYSQHDPQTLFDGILDQLINQTIIAQSMDGEISKRSALNIENETRAIVASEVMDSIFSSEFTEEEIQAAYQSAYLESDPDIEYNAAHILVKTKDEAEELVQKLADGAEFAALAREFSTGPSGPNGGNLGWFGKGVMVEPFFDAVVGLEPGGVSDPVETQFGWHVIQLQETRSRERPSLEDVREALLGEMREEKFNTMMDELKGNATIERTDLGIVPADVINRIELLGN